MLRLALFAFGYPVSVAVIVRWVPVVRQRRMTWFVLHELAVLAIVAAWALGRDWSAVAINGAWLVTAAVWYATGRPRPRRTA